MRGLKQEPRTAFGFVDPDFDQTGGGIVVGLGSHFVGCTQAFDQGPVVSMELEWFAERMAEKARAPFWRE